MLHKISQIINNPHDYKRCGQCFSINWWDNKSCWDCNNEVFIIFDYRDVIGIKDDLEDDNLDPETEELEV